MDQNDDFIMLPIVDFCFKELMQNPIVRKGFIAALLGVDPSQIEDTMLLPTILSRSSEEDKLGILDVRVMLADGTQLDLEMQVNFFEFWDERILFYLCKMFTEQLHKGDSYKKLKKCIHISILNFIHFPEDTECYRIMHFCDAKTGKVYTDKLELQFMELKKLPPDIQTSDDIITWIQFFSGKSRKEFERMAHTNKYLNEAYQALLEMSADDKKRLEYEAREKALKDYNTQIQSAERRGQELGEQIGEQRGLELGERRGIQIGVEVYKLFASGATPEEISSICNMSIEQVNEILA